MKKSKDIFKFFTNTVSLLFGSFLFAFSIYVFTIPAKFAPGGVSGLATIIQILTDFPAGYSVMLINLPLIILAFIFLSKIFALKTFICIVLTSFLLQLFAETDFYEFAANEPFLSALAGGILSGFGIGFLINAGVSPGGTEIVGILIQQKFNYLSISWIVFVINIFIIILGGILYYIFGNMSLTDVIRIILYSFFQVFMNSRSMEVILNGISSTVKFEVITRKADELGVAIREELARTVTIVEARGGYSKEDSQLLICVVTKMQIGQFKKLLKRVDPSAFAISISTREVIGSSFGTMTIKKD